MKKELIDMLNSGEKNQEALSKFYDVLKKSDDYSNDTTIDKTERRKELNIDGGIGSGGLYVSDEDVANLKKTDGFNLKKIMSLIGIVFSGNIINNMKLVFFNFKKMKTFKISKWQKLDVVLTQLKTEKSYNRLLKTKYDEKFNK